MRILSIVLAFVFVIAVASGTVSGDSKKHKKIISSTLAEEHPKNWVDEDFHGEYVEKYGDSKCKECHGSDLKGDDKAPSCKGCHDKHDGDSDHKKKRSKHDD